MSRKGFRISSAAGQLSAPRKFAEHQSDHTGPESSLHPARKAKHKSFRRDVSPVKRHGDCILDQPRHPIHNNGCGRQPFVNTAEGIICNVGIAYGLGAATYTYSGDDDHVTKGQETESNCAEGKVPETRNTRLQLHPVRLIITGRRPIVRHQL